jgi:hypothetical protein
MEIGPHLGGLRGLNPAAARIAFYRVCLMELVVRFSGNLWEYQGEAPWHFITLPEEDSDDILERVPERRAFGSVRVSVAIGGSRWQTSLFPDKAAGSFVLPVKREIREREGLSPGDTTDVELRLAVE